MKSLVIIGLFVATLIPSAGGAAPASETLKRLLLSPGKLNTAHASLEGDCDACHADFVREDQPAHCLACHKEIARDFDRTAGFHGRLKQRICSACHTEHRGPEAKITVFDTVLFDHAATDFALEGAHRALVCRSCHNDDARSANEFKGDYRLERHGCADCHADPHGQALGSACAECHDAKGWTSSTFDHGTTQFPLSGAHRQVLCSACHMDLKFASAARCSDCHEPDDAHLGVFGARCERCHTTTAWTKGRFAHDETRFPLRAAHSGVECASCHTMRNQSFASLFSGRRLRDDACVTCHAEDDVHQRAFGQKCATCHRGKRWGDHRFDHDTTQYKLRGIHVKVPCAACHDSHESAQARKVRSECSDCHEQDDVHSGALGRACGECHEVNATWKEYTYDHDFSTFAVNGLHRRLPCAECHLSRRFDSAPEQCVECHRDTRAHPGVFEDRCERCHTTAGWTRVRFDHATQTDFALLGSHADAACLDCHSRSLRNPWKPPNACVGCHRDDDVHQRRFGIDCGHCHSTSSFKDQIVPGRLH